MLSIVVYGRNDSHGYNLSRRAALGLNCLAELLTEPGDEIVFVDYNTPDELPSFPEAIADTLTPAALDRLRVIRVRSEQCAPGSRAVVEPVARNVGIRRSNPANRWILSTNADMILVPRRDGWLDGLEPRLHHLPRFELPQGAWERLDRRNPAEALDFLRRWGGRMGLHAALRMHDFLLYDAPGDFQLFPATTSSPSTAATRACGWAGTSIPTWPSASRCCGGSREAAQTACSPIIANTAGMPTASTTTTMPRTTGAASSTT